MKKALASILLLIYFTVTTGFSLSIHYCMQRFQSAEMGTSQDDKCHKCGMKKDGGCCRDVVKLVKLEASHLVSKVVTADFSVPVPQAIETEFLLTPFKNYTESFLPVEHGPPLSGQDVYLKNCVFRI